MEDGGDRFASFLLRVSLLCRSGSQFDFCLRDLGMYKTTSSWWVVYREAETEKNIFVTYGIVSELRRLFGEQTCPV